MIIYDLVTGLEFYVRLSECISDKIVQSISAFKSVYYSTECILGNTLEYILGNHITAISRIG